MEHFVYRGYIVDYKIRDGKIIVSSIYYGSKERDWEQTFSSIGEMRRYIDAGGWETEFSES